MNLSPEKALFEFLEETKTNAGAEEEIKSAAVHPTLYGAIEGVKSVRLGNCESVLSPDPEFEIKESDASTFIEVLVRVHDSSDTDEFVAARETLRDLTFEILKSFYADQDLGARVCDFQLGKTFRGWSRHKGATFATAVIPIVINPV